jgi:hypothetical protein
MGSSVSCLSQVVDFECLRSRLIAWPRQALLQAATKRALDMFFVWQMLQFRLHWLAILNSLQRTAGPVCWEQGQSSAEDYQGQTEAPHIFVK